MMNTNFFFSLKNLNQKLPIIFVLFFVFSFGLQAQNPADSTIRKNILKLDVTSFWLYRNSFIVTYERVVKPNQTFAITAGFQNLPPLASIDSIKITSNIKHSGVKFGGEYRFYLKKENKFNAPHGVYIGPYVSYLNFINERGIQVDNNGTIQSADLSAKINIMNIGAQLGYQFVINNRWTIDLVLIGPSISHYRANFTMSGNFDFDSENVENAVIKALIDKYPGLAQLIDENQVSSNGKLSTWAYGFRYQFHVGYNFGRITRKK